MSLSLAYSGGVSECIFHSVPDMVRNFNTVSAWPGHERNLMVPDFAADRCDRVAEGQDRFRIPCGSSGLELLRFMEIVCPECYDREQSEQDRCGAKDCFIRPLALGFDAKVSANFRKRHLDLPAADEPRENVARASIEVGGEECLWLELTSRIADEKPSNRYRRHAAAIPQRGAGGDFDEAVGSAIPKADTVTLPDNPAILDDGGQLFQGLTFDRPAAAAFALLRREVEQVGIETQAGDDTDMGADRRKKFDGCKRTSPAQHSPPLGLLLLLGARRSSYTNLSVLRRLHIHDLATAPDE